MATKFKIYFDRMLAAEPILFKEFEDLHTRYSQNQDGLQAEFNKQGEKIMTVIKDWEAKLCSQSEKAGYGGYTTTLSEKFMSEVRNKFPLIDYVGVISKKEAVFAIKKISL